MSNGGISSGVQFPSGINVGALHFKLDEGVYYRYLGGGVATNPLNWVVFGGVINGDPDTIGWGERQDGALWFNSILNVLRVWNGISIQSVGVGAYTTLQQNGVSITGRSVINVVGRNALVDDSGGITSRFRMNDPSTMSYVCDDFIGGTTTLFNGTIGDLGWLGNQSGSGVILQPTLVIGDVSHPGVKRLSTGITSGSFAYIHLPSTSAFNIFLVDNFFDVLFIVNLRQSDANTKVVIGLETTPVPPVLSGIRIEKGFADTAWFAFTGDGAIITRASLGAIVVDQWEKFRVRRVDAATMGFIRGAAAEVLISTTMLASATGLCVSVYIENNAAADKNLDVDYFDMLVTGLVR